MGKGEGVEAEEGSPNKRETPRYQFVLPVGAEATVPPRVLECRAPSVSDQSDDPSARDVTDLTKPTEDTWILFIALHEPRLLPWEDVIQLVDCSDISSALHVYPIKPYVGVNVINHFVKETKKIIKKYNIELTVCLSNFLVGIRNTPHGATIRFVGLETNRFNLWSQKMNLSTPPKGQSTEDIFDNSKGKSWSIFQKLFKPATKKNSKLVIDSIQEENDTKVDECQEKGEEAGKQDASKNYGENLTFPELRSGFGQLGMYSGGCISEDSGNTHLHKLTSKSKAAWDINKTMREIEYIKACIEDSEDNIFQSLTKYLSDGNSPELLEVTKEKLKGFEYLRERGESLALNLLNEQLKQTTEDLSSAQANIMLLTNKNRKIDNEKLELCKQVEKLELQRMKDFGDKESLANDNCLVRINESLRSDYVAVKHEVVFLEGELKKYEEEVHVLREQLHSQGQQLHSFRAGHRRLTAERYMEQTLLKKEISFKDKIILDATEEGELLLQSLESVQYVFIKICPESGIEKPKIENSSLVDMVQLGRHWVEDFKKSLESIQYHGSNNKQMSLRTSNESWTPKSDLEGDRSSNIEELSSSNSSKEKKIVIGRLVQRKKEEDDTKSLSEAAVQDIRDVLDSQMREMLEERSRMIDHILELENGNRKLKESMARLESEVEQYKSIDEAERAGLKEGHAAELGDLKRIQETLVSRLDRLQSEKARLEEAFARTKKENQILIQYKSELLAEINCLQDVVERAGREVSGEDLAGTDGIADACLRFLKDGWDAEAMLEMVKEEEEAAASTEHGTRDAELRGRRESEAEKERLEAEVGRLRAKAEDGAALLGKRTEKCRELGRRVEEAAAEAGVLRGRLSEAEARAAAGDAALDRLKAAGEELKEAELKVLRYELHVETMDRDFKKRVTELEELLREEARRKYELEMQGRSYRSMVESLEEELQRCRARQEETDALLSLSEGRLLAAEQSAQTLHARIQQFAERDKVLSASVVRLQNNVKRLEEELTECNTSTADYQQLRRNCDELNLTLRKNEEELKEMTNKVLVKDQLLNEATKNLERVCRELCATRTSLQKSQETLSTLKEQIREEKSKLMNELNVANKEKLGAEKLLSDTLCQKKNLEKDHEKLCDKLIKAIKMIMDGKMSAGKLEAQLKAQETIVEQLRAEKESIEQKLVKAKDMLDSAKGMASTIESEKQELVQKISEAMTKSVYEKMMKELKKKLASHQEKFTRERVELENMIVNKQDLIDQKELCIQSLQERVTQFTEGLKEMRDQLLQQKQAQHNLQNHILIIEYEKKELLYYLRELNMKIELEKKIGEGEEPKTSHSQISLNDSELSGMQTLSGRFLDKLAKHKTLT